MAALVPLLCSKAGGKSSDDKGGKATKEGKKAPKKADKKADKKASKGKGSKDDSKAAKDAAPPPSTTATAAEGAAAPVTPGGTDAAADSADESELTHQQLAEAAMSVAGGEGAEEEKKKKKDDDADAATAASGGATPAKGEQKREKGTKARPGSSSRKKDGDDAAAAPRGIPVPRFLQMVRQIAAKCGVTFEDVTGVHAPPTVVRQRRPNIPQHFLAGDPATCPAVVMPPRTFTWLSLPLPLLLSLSLLMLSFVCRELKGYLQVARDVIERWLTIRVVLPSVPACPVASFHVVSSTPYSIDLTVCHASNTAVPIARRHRACARPIVCS